MPTFVVLLRGVNVGKAKRVPMAEFKDLLAGLGCTRATTLLNSGNAVVEAPKTSPQAFARRIAEALVTRFGFEVPVVALTARDLTLIVKENTLVTVAEDHSRLLVTFAQDHDSITRLGVLAGLVSPSERFLIGAHAAYLYCADGILASPAAEALLGKVGRAVTTRNWATVLKLHALVEQGAD